jgi:hypothetical protein
MTTERNPIFSRASSLLELVKLCLAAPLATDATAHSDPTPYPDERYLEQ